MRYNLFIDIERPREEVFKKFDDPENLSKWQPGLLEMTLIKGKPGEIGSKHKMLYHMGHRKVEMIETLEARDAPKRLCGTYEADGVWNRVDNLFEEIDDHSTRWISEVEFRFRGWTKLMGWLMPGAFKKQSYQYMKNFKEFIEKED